MRPALVFLILSFSISFVSKAQEDCEGTLSRAVDEFNSGHFYGLPQILKPCVDNGFSREQRQRAYLLLTHAYLLLDDPIAAEDSYLKLLQANPEFETDVDRDPIEVVYISKKFTAAPIFSIYGSGGLNAAFPRVIQTTHTTGYPDVVSKKYNLRVGWQLAAGVDYHFTNRLTLAAEANFALLTYKRTTTDIFGINRDSEEVTNRHQWLSVPLLLRYSDIKGKNRPYGYIGYAASFLFSDRAVITTYNRDPSAADGQGLSSENRESPTIDFTSRRNRFARALVIGGGVRQKIGLDYAFVDLRYSFGHSNIVRTDRLYYNHDNTADPSNETIFLYGFADDLFRLDNIVLSVGYVKPLYKPRKLKHARTKSVLRSIRKRQGE